ncbi:regucalcin-like isoform X2 [Macrobrachium nipponense]|uniref:regucalcin-like isoform X2 n=1 Tax=Macrobrachium nipponense TaxID=159736 RepID=UPI0030C82053
MSKVGVRQVVDPVHLGEGPHWEENNQSLLFVDIMSCELHRYFPASGRHQILHINDCGTGKSVGFVVPLEGDPNLLVVGLGRSLAVVEWSPNDVDDKTVDPKVVLQTVDEGNPTNRFNDGKCDPCGRLWAGTMGYETVPGQPDLHKGSLFSLDSKLSISQCLQKISISNGLAWTHDRKTFYYIDSLEYSVDAFDYNETTGEIGNRRKVLDYKSSGLAKDIPDGMCIDVDGNLWVANFYGKKVICIDPRAGKIIQTIEMPAQNMTSVCWGGPNYDILYATSSRTGVSPDDPNAKYGGATFAITGLGTKGQKPSHFRVDLQLLRTKYNK